MGYPSGYTEIFDKDGILHSSIIPVAKSGSLGGVKSGGDINVEPDGTMLIKKGTHNLSNVKAAAAITAQNIIVGTNNGYKNLNANSAWDISYPILYANEDIAVNAVGTNNTKSDLITITPTQNINLILHSAVYIKGWLNGKIFTPVSSEPLTQTVPSVQDGYTYILLGIATSTDEIILDTEHPLYAHDGTTFRQVTSTKTLAPTIFFPTEDYQIYFKENVTPTTNTGDHSDMSQSHKWVWSTDSFTMTWSAHVESKIECY